MERKEKVLGSWVTNVCSTFTGYMISRRGAERLLESAFPIDMHVDLYTCLNGELNRIMTVYHKQVNVGVYALTTHDSDIQADAENSCEVCDVPTHYKRKGIVIVSIPTVVTALVVIGGLWYLSQRRRR